MVEKDGNSKIENRIIFLKLKQTVEGVSLT